MGYWRILLIFLLAIVVCSLSCTTPVTTQPTIPSSTLPKPSLTLTPRQLIENKTIKWNEASKYVGERITVCGEVISTTNAFSSPGNPTFLNIGRPYPDPKRFTIVIWGENRNKFSTPPDIYYRNKNICVSGLITLYEGVPEIEVSNPSQIALK